jgi:hemoglobin
MKQDITTSEDIRLLVNSFYEKAKKDETIGYVFNDVAQTNWEEHLPRMYGFWEILLLGKPGITTNPMERHIEINAMEKITEAHFDQWVKLWFETIDELFEGPNANIAKERTQLIRQTMYQRIRMSESANT